MYELLQDLSPSCNQVNSFWSRVSRGPPNSCWIWRGPTAPGKSLIYGCLYWNGSLKKAHRVAYEIATGAIPEGVLVRHICDVPLFVNPDHLVLGTWADNVRDTSLRHKFAARSKHLPGAHKKTWGRWCSEIRLNKRVKHLGSFATELEAHKAYVQAYEAFYEIPFTKLPDMPPETGT